MRTGQLVAFCIPTVLVSLVSDFIPWGLATAVLTSVLYGVILFVPSKSLAKLNANTALEGLTNGDVRGAKEHIEIAIREAQAASKLSASDLNLVRSACHKVAAALVASGQPDAAEALRQRAEALGTDTPGGTKDESG